MPSWHRCIGVIITFADLDQIESSISNLSDITKSIPIKRTIGLVNQLYEISESVHIPPNQVPINLKQKIKEKERIEEEVRKAGAILKQKNIVIFKPLMGSRNWRNRYGMSMESTRKLVSVLLKISGLDYDPLKIVKNWRE